MAKKHERVMASVENYKNLRWGSSSPVSLKSGLDVTPRVYLGYAMEDLSLGKGSRTFVNSVSNAKRALHLQAEIISNAFGINECYPKGMVPFPKRIEYLRDCGIVGERILRKYNKIRNSVEHDYYLPSEHEADDFIDVVELFIAATDRLIMCFPSEAEIEYSKKKEGCPEIGSVIFKPGEGKLYLHTSPCTEESIRELKNMDMYDWMKKYSIIYTPKDKGREFYGWVSWLVHAHI